MANVDELENERLKRLLDYQGQIALTNYDTVQSLLLLVQEQVNIIKLQSDMIAELISSLDRIVDTLDFLSR